MRAAHRYAGDRYGPLIPPTIKMVLPIEPEERSTGCTDLDSMSTSLVLTRSHPAAGNSHRVRPRYERPRWDLADCAACRTMPRAFAPVKPRTARGPVCRIC